MNFTYYYSGVWDSVAAGCCIWAVATSCTWARNYSGLSAAEAAESVVVAAVVEHVSASPTQPSVVRSSPGSN